MGLARIKWVDVTQEWVVGIQANKSGKGTGGRCSPLGRTSPQFLVHAFVAGDLRREKLEQLRRFAAAVMVTAGVIMVI